MTALHPTLTVFTGEKELRTNGVPPQLVWIPQDSGFAPPEKKAMNPRSLWTETITVMVYLWAIDFDALDALKVDLIRVIHRACCGSYNLQTAARAQPDWLTSGESMTLTVVFMCPVTERGLATVVPTQFQPALGVTGDGILDSGDTE